MKVEEAMDVLIKALKQDTGYRQSWIANIAMAYMDCEHWYKEKHNKNFLNKNDKHIIANDAAEHFLRNLME